MKQAGTLCCVFDILPIVFTESNLNQVILPPVWIQFLVHSKMLNILVAQNWNKKQHT